jgi:TPP-dependent pyruvate/acetoin dehydrogenase alpha subunit
VSPEDWVFSTHRSHYHALLKGVPRELVKQEIINGHSITLNFKEYRFFSSAIVGGCLPIAVGVGMGGQRVWTFCGDMAATTGIFEECLKYASGHDLPVSFIVENNGLSVKTPTAEVWGTKCKWNKLSGYRYKNTYPHQGTGTYVIF